MSSGNKQNTFIIEAVLFALFISLFAIFPSIFYAEAIYWLRKKNDFDWDIETTQSNSITHGMPASPKHGSHFETIHPLPKIPRVQNSAPYFRTSIEFEQRLVWLYSYVLCALPNRLYIQYAPSSPLCQLRPVRPYKYIYGSSNNTQ